MNLPLNQLTFKLSSSYLIPLLGFGTWKTSDPSSIVSYAIQNGYRHIDTACDYGIEKEVGEGLRKGMEITGIGRQDLFVTSKLWNTYHRPEHVKLACKKTLFDLKLDYLDLYLIHFPLSVSYVNIEENYPPSGENVNRNLELISIHDTWKAMEELVGEGLVKSIGISNFNVQLILELLSKATIRPSVLQIEYHPYLQQSELVKFCHRFNIHVTAYSPFGNLSYLEDSELAKKTKNVFELETIKRISSKYNVTPSQVILRWLTQEGLSVIPKSNNEQRVKQNIDIWNFKLTDSDINEIHKLNSNTRFNETFSWTGVPLYS